LWHRLEASGFTTAGGAHGGFAEFERYDGIGLAKLVRDKEVSAAELLDAAIERVESRNAVVNAVVYRTSSRLRTPAPTYSPRSLELTWRS
jgi:hypothetical protein